MAGSVKFICLAAALVLLLLQSADGSDEQSFEEKSEEDISANPNNSNINENGKKRSLPTVDLMKRTGSNIVQVGNNLPRLIKGKVTNAKDEVAKEINELSKNDNNKNAKFLQRKVSIPAKAVSNVGINFIANETEKYVKKFQNEFNNRDKLTPDGERDDTIAKNLKRYMSHPLIVTTSIAGVAADAIKRTSSSLTKKNNDDSNTNERDKKRSLPTLDLMRRTGSNIVQVGNNLPKRIKGTVMNAKDKVVNEINKRYKKENNNSNNNNNSSN